MVQMKIKPKEEFTPKQAETESEVDELDEKPDITEFAQEVDAIEEKPLKPSKKRGRSVRSQSSEEDPPKPNKKKQRGAGEMGEGGKKMGNWSSDEDWAMFCTIFPKPSEKRLFGLLVGGPNIWAYSFSPPLSFLSPPPDILGTEKNNWAAVIQNLIGRDAQISSLHFQAFLPRKKQN